MTNMSASCCGCSLMLPCVACVDMCTSEGLDMLISVVSLLGAKFFQTTVEGHLFALHEYPDNHKWNRCRFYRWREEYFRLQVCSYQQ